MGFWIIGQSSDFLSFSFVVFTSQFIPALPRFNFSDVDFPVKEGDRIAQLVLERIYTPEVVEVDVRVPAELLRLQNLVLLIF